MILLCNGGSAQLLKAMKTGGYVQPVVVDTFFTLPLSFPITIKSV